MTREKAIELLEKIDVKFFLSGMMEQRDYIVDKADEVNVAIETVLSSIEEKDKQIDLMSEQLTTPVHSKEWVKMYYENKVKEREINENREKDKTSDIL